MMNEQGAANQFTRREEKKLLELASEYVRSGFPNPERLGCPGSEALKSIAGDHDGASSAERPYVAYWVYCSLGSFGALRRPHDLEMRLLHNNPRQPSRRCSTSGTGRQRGLTENSRLMRHSPHI